MSMMTGVGGGPVEAPPRPLGRLMLSSRSTIWEPAEAMKNRRRTKTTSTIGAIWKPTSPSSEPTEPPIT
jgi:hypothetical protein